MRRGDMRRGDMRWLAIVVGVTLLSVLAASLLQVAGSASPARASEVVCNGKERWKVKTLADVDAGDVELDPSTIKHTSVKTLRKKKPPPGKLEARVAPVETTVYEVEATLVKARWIWNKKNSVPVELKGDRDIHLVIADPTDETLTMIAEFPDPACVAAEAPLKKMMRDARTAFLDCKGLMPSSDKPFQPLTGTATVNGVGFFDRPHATGHAPYGVELHPVLYFSSTDCGK